MAFTIDRKFRCNSCGFKDLEKKNVSDHVKAEHRDAKGKVFGKVLKPKIPSWARLRKVQRASEHVRVSMLGETDTITCLECGEIQDLRGQRIGTIGGQGDLIPPDKVLDNFTRKHFYRHELINKFC